MNHIKYILSCLLCFVVVFVQAQELPPKPNKLVNDYLDILTDDQEYNLEQKLRAYDKKTSNQIVIITTNDMGGRNAGDFATEVGKAWGVGGTAAFNNGVILLIYRSKDNTARKIFIAVGKGLEDKVPDYTAGQIVANDITPYLRQSDFYRGLDNGTNKIAEAIGGKYVAPKNYNNKDSGFPLVLVIILLIFFLVIMSRFSKHRGQYTSRRGYTGYDGPTIWWTGGGSGWSGDGNSGGGGGGIDFGGFGGGDFGGGGAGGDW